MTEDQLNNFSNELETLTKAQQLNMQLELMRYKKMPPTIREFITKDYYLGKEFGNGILYEYWIDKLEEIFPDPINIRHPYIMLTGPIGIGKSTVAKIIALYTLCKLDHLKDLSYFAMSINKTIDWIFSHVSAGKAYDDLIVSCWNMYAKSPYFQTEFKWKSNLYQFVPEGPRNSAAIGSDCIFYTFSEINFLKFDLMKHRIDQSYSRYQARFMRLEGLIGNIILDSSSAGDASITNYLIRESPMPLHIINDPIWIVKFSTGLYGRQGWFKVYTGDIVILPFIITEDKPLTDECDPDKVLTVPNELLIQYQSDIYLALQNTAGISTSSSDTFFQNKEALNAAICLPNRIADSILVDFYNEDDLWSLVRTQIMKCIPEEKIIFIGIDLGVSVDYTGFSIGYFDDFVYKDGKATKEIKIEVPFSVAINRLPGQETSIMKIFNLVMAINEHFEIGAVTFDTYQSTTLRQELQRALIYTYAYSVDRTQTAYIYLKHQIYKGLTKLCNNGRLRDELHGLIDTGYKIDHTSDGTKDISDSVTQCHQAIYDNLDKAVQLSAKYAAKKQIEALRQRAILNPQNLEKRILNSRNGAW